MSAASFPALLQRFFTDRLVHQLDASEHTVASYSDTFRLLLGFAEERLGRAPSALNIEDLDASFISLFLDHLESGRHNCIRTRNTRLAALHAFFRYAAFSEPAHVLQCQQVLAIPGKRHEHGPVEFLSQKEAAALTAAPDPSRWIGKRDRTLLLLALQTGLRCNELISLRRRDVEFGVGAHVRCIGKGRKMRCTPLRPDVAHAIASWLKDQDGLPEDALFPSSSGKALSPDAVQRLVARHTAAACRSCPCLLYTSPSPRD